MRILLYSVLIVFCLISCKGKEGGNWNGVVYKIEQRMEYDSPYNLCYSLTGCFVTYVYKGQSIIYSHYDHPKFITDSLKSLRIEWAKDIIRKDKNVIDTTIYIK